MTTSKYSLETLITYKLISNGWVIYNARQIQFFPQVLY